jgi:hypothetical protein
MEHADGKVDFAQKVSNFIIIFASFLILGVTLRNFQREGVSMSLVLVGIEDLVVLVLLQDVRTKQILHNKMSFLVCQIKAVSVKIYLVALSEFDHFFFHLSLPLDLVPGC